MIIITEYKTKNFRVEAKESRGTLWISIYFSGQELSLFFDTQAEFDFALKNLQNCPAPETELSEDSLEENFQQKRDLDDDVPF